MQRNKFFLIIIVVIIAGQALIVEFGSTFTSTTPLNVEEWFSCIGLAFLMWPLGLITRLIPMPKTKEEMAENPNDPPERRKQQV